MVGIPCNTASCWAAPHEALFIMRCYLPYKNGISINSIS